MEKLINKSTQRGITLIALVVTIIVLLILAGITINLLFSNNGIIERAQQAKNEWSNAENSELNDLKNVEDVLNHYTNSTVEEPLDYVKDGLVVHLDGINNTGNGHSDSATIWKNLAFDSYDATIYGATWKENSLVFDGIDDFATIKNGNLQYPNVTIQAVASHGSETESYVINSMEAGGIALSDYMKGGYNGFVFFRGDYTRISSDTQYVVDKIYSLSGSFDKNQIIFFENGKTFTTSNSGTLYYNPNTPFTFGANAYSESASDWKAKERIYSIRIYNRALTDEELLINYEQDKKRFSITD